MRQASLATLLSLAAASAPLSAQAAPAAGFGQAFSLSGSTYYEKSNILLSASVTAEAWFKTSSPGSTMALFSQKAGLGLGAVGRIWLQLKGGFLATDIGGTTFYGRTAVTANTWHHAAVVHDRSVGRLYLYLDGVLDASGSAFIEKVSGNFVIGANATATGSFFIGQIDEVRCWRRARGKYEIQRDMHLSLSGSEPKLAFRESFNSPISGVTTVANDKASFGTLSWEGARSGYLPGSDSAGATVSFALAAQAAMGTATVDAATGQFTYTPTSSTAFGSDSFMYTVTAGGTSATGTMTVAFGKLLTRFTFLSGSTSPLYGTQGSLGDFAALVDWDMDGDLDLFTYNADGRLDFYWKNQGTAYSPSFSKSAPNPLAALTIPWYDGGYSEPGGDELIHVPWIHLGFTDAGADRDWDPTIVASWDEKLLQYENIGSTSSPSFAASNAIALLMSGGTNALSIYQGFTSLVDLTYDGFADLILTNGEPAGPAGIPKTFLSVFGGAFTYQSASDPLKNISFGSTDATTSVRSATAGDFDGDGDIDAVLGTGKGSSYMYYFENTGAVDAAAWTQRSASATFDHSVNFDHFPAPADLDGDGDLDLIVSGLGNGYGAGYFQNTSRFVSSNAAPTATSLSVSGTLLTSNTLQATYTYYDADGDPMSSNGTSSQWQRANDASGASASVVQSGSASYSLGASDAGKYVRFCVTPNDGMSSGAQTCSTWQAVRPTLSWYKHSNYSGTSVTIDYGGFANGACKNLTSFDFPNDEASSVSFYGWGGNYTHLGMYKDQNCSGSKSGLSASPGHTAALSNLTTVGLNDKVTSFRVSWNSGTVSQDMNGTCYGLGSTVLTHEGAKLVFQTDGNLVLSKLFASGRQVVWASDTDDQGATQVCAQSDGNLVIYDGSRQPHWASNTSGNSGAILKLQRDCNLVIYSTSGSPQWDTNSDGCW